MHHWKQTLQALTFANGVITTVYMGNWYELPASAILQTPSHFIPLRSSVPKSLQGI